MTWTPSELGPTDILLEIDTTDQVSERNEEDNARAVLTEVVSPFPSVEIFQPADQAVIDPLENGSLILSGQAIDVQEGELSGNQLVWSSSLDGFLGQDVLVEDVLLSEGVHEIALEATNSGGLSSTAVVTVNVPTSEPSLAIVRAGTGSGEVVSDPPGIDCGEVCFAHFPEGTLVNLTASEGPQSNFIGWAGSACNGLSPCRWMAEGGTVITALFEAVEPRFDVVVAANSSGLWASDETGQFSLSQSLSTGGDRGYSVEFGDLDGDGDTDAYLGLEGADRVYLNDGLGTLAYTGDELESARTSSVSLGDIDRDGDLDALLGTDLGPSLWINDGTGLYQDSQADFGATQSLAVKLVDLDGDGWLDAVMERFDLEFWINDGTGSLVLLTAIPQPFIRTTDIELADLDGDGDLDIFRVSDEHPATVLFSSGGASFFDSGQLLGLGEQWDVALGDLDGDSDLDAFVAVDDLSGNQVWLNDGTGFFVDSGQALGTNGSKGVALRDFDQDGDLDAITANTTTLGSDPRDRVWLNDGTGQFVDSGQLLSGSYGRGIAAANLRGARTLSVELFGAGQGAVTSLPDGIDCGIDCLHRFPPGSTIVLQAEPDPGYEFLGWSGHPDCFDSEVTLGDNVHCVAHFDLPSHELTVVLDGPGAGAVTSTPLGLDCPPACVATFIEGTSVELAAAPASGSFFLGWSGGGCAGTGLCTTTVSAPSEVTASFGLESFSLTITRDGDGQGTVTSDPSGIACGSDCSESFLFGTPVTLSAVAAADSEFVGWSGGGCTGTAPCLVTIEEETSVTATFQRTSFFLTVELDGAGAGSVGSDPAGIDCGSECTASFPRDTSVDLTATPVQWSAFGGWSGDCTGQGSCTVVLDQDVLVTARFDALCLDLLETGSGNWQTLAGPNDGGLGSPWTLSSGQGREGTTGWFVPNEPLLSDQLLELRADTTVTAGAPVLKFWQQFDTEPGRDGGVLEYSVDGGLTWWDILEGDGGAIPSNPARLLTGDYTGVLDTCCSNPLPGREAWTGLTNQWEQVIVDLTDFIGNEVSFRWRFGADASVAEQGWWMDEIIVLDTETCPLTAIFADGFESGDTTLWTESVP